MENIGFGIMCFGKDFYFKGTQEKLNNLLDKGYHCYVLTDNPDFFTEKYENNLSIIRYEREYKSFYDKLTLVKTIHHKHEIAIILDADLHIKNYELFEKLGNFDFNEGISYIDTLWNHTAKFKTVGDIPMGADEWEEFSKYVKEVYPNVNDLETIWEYFIVFNKKGFNSNKFFNTYEKLQVVKEFCDVRLNKDVVGAGEGIAVAVSAIVNEIPLIKDQKLQTLTLNSLKPITRHTPTSEKPNYLR